jgi:WD40 repeat protein
MTAVDPTKIKAAKDLAHDHPLIACRLDPKGRFAFATSEDRSIQRWELANGTKVPLLAHESWVHALAATPDGSTLLSGGCDGRLIWWPLADPGPKPARIVEAHRGWINGVAISPDGNLAATAGNDRFVRVWSVADGSLVAELPGHDKYAYQVAFTPGGKDLISADLQGRIIHWDLAARKEARRLDAAKLYLYFGSQGVDYGGVRDLSFSADGKYLACSGLIEASNPLGAVSNPAVVVLDWAAGKEKTLLRPKEDVKGVGWGVRCHPDGLIIAVSGGTSGGVLWFYRPEGPNETFRHNLPNTGRGLDLSPDGNLLATAHHDGHLRLWTLAAGPSA